MNMSVNPLANVQAINIQGLDLESALMAVQTNRANLLEAQLKDQIASVQAKNDQIAKMNQALGLLNKFSAQIPAGKNAGDNVGSLLNKNDDYKLEKEINTALDAAGVRPFPNGAAGRTEAWNTNTDRSTQADTVNANGTVTAKASWYLGGINGNTNKGELEGAIQQMKNQIDSLSNTQQMDMLRLQSLSNKRNEAFDVMTNFIKKMQESRSSIISNMR